MPVPRLFEASNDPREQWVHVLATLLTLGGPETRTALVEEISGEALPGADALLVFEQRPLRGGPRGCSADIIARGAGWTIAIQATPGLRRRRGGAPGRHLRRAPGGLRQGDPGRGHARPQAVAGRRARPPRATATSATAAGCACATGSRSAPSAAAAEGHRPAAAAGGRVLLHAPRGRALPPRGPHAHGRAVPAAQPGGHLLRPQRAGPGAADPERGRRRARRLPAHRRRPGRDRPGQGRHGRSTSPAPTPVPATRDAGEGWKRLKVGDAGDYLAARAWTQSTAKSLLPARR